MVSFDFYKNAYLGDTIPEAAFSGMAAQAQSVLERFRRIYRVESTGPDAESMAVCAMAETIYGGLKSRGGISSASAGTVSVHYDSSKTGHGAMMKELYDRASVYLDIYRGVRV